MSEIPKEDKKISSSTLLYHLGKLEEEKLIQSEKIDGKRIYFPKNLRNKEIERAFAILMNDNAKKIFLFVLNNKNSFQSQIARAINVHHDTVRHHAEKMEDAGILNKISHNKKVTYDVGPLAEKILEGSMSAFSETYIRFIISKLADDCHFPEIIEQSRNRLVIRVVCPREDDIELSIDISGWEIEESIEIGDL